MEMECVSQRKLSLCIKVDRKSVKLWMKGKNFPKYNALIRLANYFKVRVDYLIGLEDNICETTIPCSVMKEEETQRRFYRYLTKYMSKENMTKYALSQKLEIDQKAVTNWFTKGSMPEVSTLIKLARLMDISMQELLVGV